MIGELVGSYQVVQLLRQGGMGRVFLAEHPHLGRKAAVKVLLPELARLPGAGRVELLGESPLHAVVTPRSADLAARGLTGVRLSCQILCDHDMTVKAISRLAGSGRPDVGHRPADEIQPQPVEWVSK